MADNAEAGPLYPFIMVFVGCISSIVSLEYLLEINSTCGHLVTFSECLFVLLQSIPGQLDGPRLRSRAAPLGSHVYHAVLWVTMSLLVNYAYAFDVSVPIHTLFRSCNIISSVLLGFAFFGKRYTSADVLIVLAVTGGLVLATIGETEMVFEAKPRFALGIGVLTLVLFLQAWLGHTQHLLYERHAPSGGKVSRAAIADEFCFYSHIAAMAPMVFLRSHLHEDVSALLASRPLPWLPGVPAGCVWLGMNLVTQAMCIKGVFYLSANYSPLTVNLTLSVRKFCSVLLSIYWFSNPFSAKHVAASLLIFGGVFLYFARPAEKKKAA